MLLDELAERLHEKRTFAKLHVVGGACVALAYERERTTRDIDVRVDTGHEALEEAVREIAQAHDLPPQWPNDQTLVLRERTHRGWPHEATDIIMKFTERALAQRKRRSA